jgi:NADH-quinone oxidoreductase subunit E
MSFRRLAHEQPASFEFTAENKAWAEKQIAKYPQGRQASAIIPLLWRAQEQFGGWLPKPAIEYVASMLGMPYIRALENATFYTMFNLHPVGKHLVQVCTTTPCWLRGSEEIVNVCKRRIAEKPHTVSADGTFSWMEVECMGACVNAPMVQIHDDNYEDLTPESFEKILDAFASGKTPTPGPQNGRKSSEPVGGALTLTEIKA